MFRTYSGDSGFRRGRVSRFESLENRLPLSASPTVVDFEVGSTQWTTPFRDYLVEHSLGTHGYRVPTGSASQLNSLPWSNIDVIYATFSEDVDVRREHLSITGVNATSFAVEGFAYDASTYQATWVLSAPLGSNSYLVEIDGDGLAPVTNLQGDVLDGNWTTSVSAFPSGDSIAGGDFEFALRVLIGDVNQSNSVDYYDYYAAAAKNGLTTESLGYSPFYDVNGSGDHSAADASEILARLWTVHPVGDPVGLGNDAPSSRGDRYVRLAPNTVDLAIDLWDQFADAETADADLAYHVVSVSNGSLWSGSAINATTGTLTLTAASNASGRSIVVVRATDSLGQSIDARYVIDLGAANGIPQLIFSIHCIDENVWQIEGTVTDDGIVEGLLVRLTGAVQCSARVDATGSFALFVTVESEGWGNVFGSVYDWDGGRSDLYFGLLGLS